MTKQQALQTSEEIINLYNRFGGEEYAGEKVTQLQHMVQAAQLAEQQGFDEEVILAAFLHDIGHICVSANHDNGMDGYGIKDHEEVGALFLQQRSFSATLIQLVVSHVQAKRYLTYRDPGYFEQLSGASKKTLEYQGGRMNKEEAVAFEESPLFDLFIQMRRWDEAAKIEHLPAPDLAVYREMMVRHLEKQHQENAQ